MWLLVIATAPGKLILTGEYAVLDGAPALVIAVDRRVVARRDRSTGSSPFLLAVARELAQRYGADSPSARAALEIAVDSAAFYDGSQKLGLGSSAAVTVAAVALALTEEPGVHALDEILEISLAANANAQGAKGARGSGADIAAAVYGGTIVFTMGSDANTDVARPANDPMQRITSRLARSIETIASTLATEPIGDVLPTARVQRRTWPHGVTLIPFFTGVSADTATLVSRIAEARRTRTVAVDAALAAITEASRAACASLAAPPDLAPTGLIAALRLAAQATDRLAAAAGVDLVPSCVRDARSAMQALGGTAKTTGAGGGDVAIAVIPASIDVTTATRSLIEAGCQPLQLTVDDQGVDTRSVAQ
jgi:phosphomevalonate kinase